MPRSAAQTKNRIREVAFDLFYRRGYNRVGIEEIAEAASITKRTLYAHFESKDALIGDVLDAQNDLSIAQIQKWGETLDGTVDEVIDQLFLDLAKWSESPGWSGIGYTRLALELADLRGHPVRAIASRHKAAVEREIGKILKAAGAKEPMCLAREVCLLVEGANTLLVIHGDQEIAVSAAEAAKRLARTQDKEITGGTETLVKGI